MLNSGNATIRIEIDQELVSIVPDFLENRRLDCLLVERLLAEGALDEIQSLGHRMKGSGGSYGFDEISVIGEALELAAQDVDADGISAAVRHLETYLDRVSVKYI